MNERLILAQPPLDEVQRRLQAIENGSDTSVTHPVLKDLLKKLETAIQGKVIGNVSDDDVKTVQNLIAEINAAQHSESGFIASPRVGFNPVNQEVLDKQKPSAVRHAKDALTNLMDFSKKQKAEQDRPLHEKWRDNQSLPFPVQEFHELKSQKDQRVREIMSAINDLRAQGINEDADIQAQFSSLIKELPAHSVELQRIKADLQDYQNRLSANTARPVEQGKMEDDFLQSKFAEIEQEERNMVELWLNNLERVTPAVKELEDFIEENQGRSTLGPNEDPTVLFSRLDFLIENLRNQIDYPALPDVYKQAIDGKYLTVAEGLKADFFEDWKRWIDNPTNAGQVNQAFIKIKETISDADFATRFNTLKTPERDALLEEIEEFRTEVEGYKLASGEAEIRNFIEEEYLTKLREFLAPILEKDRLSRAEQTVIDPKDVWGSLCRMLGFIDPGDDLKDPNETRRHEVIKKSHDRLISWVIKTATNRLWDQPTDSKYSNFTEFLKWDDFLTPGGKVTLDNIISSFPKSGHYDQNLIRDEINHLSEILKASMSWGEIIAKPDHTKIIAHLNHHMFDGKGWHELMELPTFHNKDVHSREQGEHEPGFGEEVFEGLNWYSQWNIEFIYLNQEELAAVSSSVENMLSAGDIKVPSENELKAELERLKRTKNVNLINFQLGRTKVTAATVLELYAVEAEYNYAEFKRIYKIELKNNIIKNKQAERQDKYGIHPLREKGEQAKFVGGPSVIEKRQEIAMAIGFYRLGLGNYRPNIGSEMGLVGKFKKPDGTLIRHEPGTLLNANGEVVEITQEMFEEALKIGKAAELFAFGAYIGNGAAIFDDDITAKSAVTAGRLAHTSTYRENYEGAGREGIYRESVALIRQLIPHPFLYMGANRTRLKKLFGDREKRKHANYLAMGDSETGLKRNFIELYEFASSIYDALAYGLSEKAVGVNILGLGKLSEESKNNLFRRDKRLEFNTEGIKKLIDWVDKTIGYYADRLYKTVGQVEGPDSPFDPVIWQEIENSSKDGNRQNNIVSPVLRFNLNLPGTTMSDGNKKVKNEEVAKTIRQKGFKRTLIPYFFTPILIESLMRSYKKKISVVEEMSLLYLLGGEAPTGQYTVTYDRDNAAELLNLNRSEEIFGYDNANQIRNIIKKAGMRIDNWFEGVLAEIRGI